MIRKWIIGLISVDAIRRTLARRNFQFQWRNDDSKNLENFMLGATGSKLLAYLDSVLQAQLMDASSEADPKLALHKLATAKGFGLALGAIRLSMPQPVFSESVEPEIADPFMNPDAHEEDEPAKIIPFVNIKSQPTVY